MPDNLHFSTALSDRYVMERELGAGGMAVVYLARDRKLDREVALKVLRPELGAVLGAERFLTEIKISARLDHPHILTLIDSGDADGMLYYVLPYVRGESLRDKLKREHQLALEDAVTITKQVASALDYAHRQGLVHRDIKPENILLQEGEAMLTDFGIALAVREAGGTRLTESGLSLGTPQYMSPEQATADRSIDARSDVYSLASVLYEMLAGEPPVTGATAQAMVAKLMTEKPTSLRVLRDTVPEEVDRAIAKALAKTPADRFASAGEFVRAVEAGMSRRSVRAPVAAAPRHQKTLIGSAIAVGAVVLAVSAYAAFGKSGGAAPTASLGTKTQLTISGGIWVPAISPDGKQLAYAARKCAGAECTYSVVVQDVGGTTTRTILENADIPKELRWSPDRRNLMFRGVVNGRDGAHLLSALSDTPRFLTAGPASFYAGGDSLLIGSANVQDSVFWIRVSGLDGIARDSIAVHEKGRALFNLSDVPGSPWILAGIDQPTQAVWKIIARTGKVADQVANSCSCGGIGSSDAIWLVRPTAAGLSIVRIAFDPGTGRLSTRQDTMVTGAFTNFTVTADGARLVMDQGTFDKGVWPVTYQDLIAGRLPEGRRVVSGSSALLGALISPDGQHVLVRRSVPGSDGRTEVRYIILPYDGGSETPVRSNGRITEVWWGDSASLAVTSAVSSNRRRLAVVDVRTGAERNVFEIPAGFLAAVPLDTGWAWIPIAGDSLIIARNGERRSPGVLRSVSALRPGRGAAHDVARAAADDDDALIGSPARRGGHEQLQRRRLDVRRREALTDARAR